MPTAQPTTSSSPSWTGLAPTTVIEAVAAAGLSSTGPGPGVILHMLSLAIDGQAGLTAIGAAPDDAERMHQATRATVDEAARP